MGLQIASRAYELWRKAQSIERLVRNKRFLTMMEERPDYEEYVLACIDDCDYQSLRNLVQAFVPSEIGERRVIDLRIMASKYRVRDYLHLTKSQLLSEIVNAQEHQRTALRDEGTDVASRCID